MKMERKQLLLRIREGTAHKNAVELMQAVDMFKPQGYDSSVVKQQIVLGNLDSINLYFPEHKQRYIPSSLHTLTCTQTLSHFKT